MLWHNYQSSLLESQTSNSKSSLLIPAKLLWYFHNRCAQQGSRSAYFKLIVAKYIPQIAVWKNLLDSKRDLNWKTVYQSRDQELIKKNFLPDGKDWECLRHAACVCGVSMCFLFVFLMELESEGFFEKNDEESCGGWNSVVEWVLLRIKLGKFSKISRKMDVRKGRLRRRIRIV